MTEQIPTPEEYRLLEKTLMEKILDQAATDPQWKQLLLEDPEAAMQEAAFPETHRLMEMNERVRAMQEDAEAVGHLGYAAPLCLPVSAGGNIAGNPSRFFCDPSLGC